jgi:hypothetical protein
VSIVTSRQMAAMAGSELSVDWNGTVGAPHYLRIIEVLSFFCLKPVLCYINSVLSCFFLP